MEEKKLTAKQELFCQRYLIDFNATKAAKEAGYSEDTAYSTGWENLRKPEIQARIAQLRQEMGKSFNITRERIAQEYARIAFFDIRKIHTVDGAIKPVTEFDDDEAAAIAGIEVYEENFKSDDPDEKIVIGKTKKIKITDKRGALDSLCKLMGYNEAEKHVFEIPSAIRIIRDKNV
jgi:phage terminase small subunit